MDIGLDRLPYEARLLARLRGSRVGVLAHPASVDRGLVHIGDVLAKLGIVPTIFFGPEHGYGGEAQDMIGVAEARDLRTGAPIVSLYGETFDSLSPTKAQLAMCDVIVIDLADVGARFYTFVWTALLVLRAAAKAGVHVVVLDRPNPLGHRDEDVEGNLAAAPFLSFVGLEPIPVRHGMTLGEIVSSFAEQDGLALGHDGALSVLTSQGHDEHEGAWAWDRPFVLPSPNMPTWETALVYPGGCLIEGTNLSEGRGLTRPFEIVGAPFVDGRALAEGLVRTALPGFFPRPLTFQPTFHKHGKQVCGGVQIHVTDRTTFRPYATYLALVAVVHSLAGDAFRFRTERYEFVDDIPAFDLLTGSAEARLGILAGADAGELARTCAKTPERWQDFREIARLSLRRASAWVDLAVNPQS